MKSFAIRNNARAINPNFCGEGCPSYVIGSVGTSSESDDLGQEVQKAKIAEEVGAHAVTDHSFYGDIAGYQTALIESLSIAVSAVTNYEWAAELREQRHSWKEVKADSALRVFEQQCARGLDMLTIHASLRKHHLQALRSSKRMIPMTSKGGGIVSNFMRATGAENPYFEFFDDFLDIAIKHNVTVSLGTSFRPASVVDRFDGLISLELDEMSRLVERCLSRGAQVMVEGIGHATLRDTVHYVQVAKARCHGVPYRVLPMCTDIALGYDHISGAIGAAVALMGGADAVTAISRAEHIGLPNEDELREAIIASKIAAHAADLGHTVSFERDEQMSRTRWGQGCKGDWTSAIFPKGAETALRNKGRLDDQIVQCTMCGDYCGIAAGISSAKKREAPDESNTG